MNQWFSINGRLTANDQAGLSPKDRGLLLGDGLFETLLVQQGVVDNFEAHWRRFVDGCQYLGLIVPVSQEALREQIELLIEYNGIESRGAIRWTLTRGTGPRGLKWPADAQPTLVITAESSPKPPGNKPWQLGPAQARRNEYSPLAQLKTLNYLDAVLAHQQACDQGYDDAVFINTQGHWVCTSMANLFFIDSNKRIITPPAEAGVLPGTTRSRVIELLREFNCEVCYQTLDFKSLTAIQGVFATNSLMGVKPVGRIGSCQFDTTLSEQWRQSYNEYVGYE